MVAVSKIGKRKYSRKLLPLSAPFGDSSSSSLVYFDSSQTQEERERDLTHSNRSKGELNLDYTALWSAEVLPCELSELVSLCFFTVNTQRALTPCSGL